jgi:hypothetical protein
MTKLSATILNAAWVEANAERLGACFPEPWTPMRDLNAAVIGERLRRVGVHWHGGRELAGVLMTLQYIGIMEVAIGRVPFDVSDIDIVRRGALRMDKLRDRKQP